MKKKKELLGLRSPVKKGIERLVFMPRYTENNIRSSKDLK